MLNKNFLTNFLACVLILIGVLLDHTLIPNMGLFALAGAITNTLAILMLFERVPFLYGSGVIPLRFNEFKRAF